MISPDETLSAPAAEPGPDVAAAGAAGEAEAWARVVAAWQDDAAHEAYLARFHDLDGLAVAGRRYREAVLSRPGDPVASRFREEVVRRATTQGLAQLPRSAPAPARAAAVRRLALALAAALVVAAAFAAFHLA